MTDKNRNTQAPQPQDETSSKRTVHPSTDHDARPGDARKTEQQQAQQPKPGQGGQPSNRPDPVDRGQQRSSSDKQQR